MAAQRSSDGAQARTAGTRCSSSMDDEEKRLVRVSHTSRARGWARVSVYARTTGTAEVIKSWPMADVVARGGIGRLR
eukprot:1407991-Prymnesium_polylepis.1